MGGSDRCAAIVTWVWNIWCTLWLAYPLLSLNGGPRWYLSGRIGEGWARLRALKAKLVLCPTERRCFLRRHGAQAEECTRRQQWQCSPVTLGRGGWQYHSKSENDTRRNWRLLPGDWKTTTALVVQQTPTTSDGGNDAFCSWLFGCANLTSSRLSQQAVTSHTASRIETLSDTGTDCCFSTTPESLPRGYKSTVNTIRSLVMLYRPREIERRKASQGLTWTETGPFPHVVVSGCCKLSLQTSLSFFNFSTLLPIEFRQSFPIAHISCRPAFVLNLAASLGSFVFLPKNSVEHRGEPMPLPKDPKSCSINETDFTRSRRLGSDSDRSPVLSGC